MDIAYALKNKNARRFFAYCTYALFTNGLEKFDKAYEEGYISGVFGTNLTYRSPELLQRPWFHEVDVSKYISYFIASINHDVSIGTVIDPHEKIKALSFKAIILTALLYKRLIFCQKIFNENPVSGTLKILPFR